MEYIINKSVKIVPLKDKAIKQLVEKVLAKMKRREATLSINLIGDSKMITLNKLYRGKNKVTDVISFALEDEQNMFSEGDLGDIFICLPQIKRQARQFKIEQKEEFVRMLIHGILHLLGFDHIKKIEEKNMFALQEKLLKEVL